ncbi:MAG TPA: SDR family NAD(P)-dependent oxidoreductase [Aliidongia sp.]|nr:SDR family NAD(P)-dependent oxidoreductase [Aliidongia sp.]
MNEQKKDGRLAGRIALVTGASRGIGAAVARRFAAEGAHVVLVARTVGALEEVDDQIQAAGGSATLVPLDLQEFDKIDQMGAALYERFGRLDILVGNAGHLGSLGPMSHQDPKVFKRVLETNVTANYRLIRSLEPLLKLAPAGRAIFTACAAGHEPTAYWSAYAVSKAALEMMVRTWGAELAKTNVKVALVDPGPVATQLRRTAFPGEDQAVMAQPDDVAGLFLEQVLA